MRQGALAQSGQVVGHPAHVVVEGHADHAVYVDVQLRPVVGRGMAGDACGDPAHVLLQPLSPRAQHLQVVDQPVRQHVGPLHDRLVDAGVAVVAALHVDRHRRGGHRPAEVVGQHLRGGAALRDRGRLCQRLRGAVEGGAAVQPLVERQRLQLRAHRRQVADRPAPQVVADRLQVGELLGRAEQAAPAAGRRVGDAHAVAGHGGAALQAQDQGERLAGLADRVEARRLWIPQVQVAVAPGAGADRLQVFVEVTAARGDHHGVLNMHGGQYQRRWQRGQWKVERPPWRSARMVAPQRGHGCPARP